MRVCLDIDDTVTYAPEFFAFLTEALPEAEVIVVSFRTEREHACRTLEEHRVRFDRLILSNDPEHGQRMGQSLVEWKASVVNDLAPDWFFEDMPEVVCRIQADIKVFMPCDDVIRSWLAEAT